MSHQALSPEQFGGTRRGISPHQFALPGMEHMAHPFAEHLARGYMLSPLKREGYGTGMVGRKRGVGLYKLSAEDVQEQRKEPAAELHWAGSRRQTPGEVEWAGNPAATWEGQTRAKGLAGALFHSAHHWDWGQGTVPIHSPLRSMAGEHFASKVRPDLKPDVWQEYMGGAEQRAPGKPAGEEPRWSAVESVPAFHPFQQRLYEQQIAHQVKQTRARQAPGQGTLF